MPEQAPEGVAVAVHRLRGVGPGRVRVRACERTLFCVHAEPSFCVQHDDVGQDFAGACLTLTLVISTLLYCLSNSTWAIIPRTTTYAYREHRLNLPG